MCIAVLVSQANSWKTNGHLYSFFPAVPAARRPKAQPIPLWEGRYFWLQYVVSLVFAAGVCICLENAARFPEIPAATVMRAGAPDRLPEAPPTVPVRPAIVIDPGHGGPDPGTIGNGQFEKTWTLSVSLALAELLRHRGWVVELTRSDDGAVSLIDRSLHANREPRLAFVSIHFNAGGPDASGVETYYAWPKNPEIMTRLDLAHRVPAGRVVLDERGRLLAEALQSKVCELTGARNRGVKNQPQLSVISRTLCPAVLVECGFLSHPAESGAIQTDDYRAKLVRGLADGLEGWLQLAAGPDFGIAHEDAASRLTLPAPVPAPENP